ncbi:unnamed protein product, partial [Protopolystoma xenopodis]
MLFCVCPDGIIPIDIGEFEDEDGEEDSESTSGRTSPPLLDNENVSITGKQGQASRDSHYEQVAVCRRPKGVFEAGRPTKAIRSLNRENLKKNSFIDERENDEDYDNVMELVGEEHDEDEDEEEEEIEMVDADEG